MRYPKMALIQISLSYEVADPQKKATDWQISIVSSKPLNQRNRTKILLCHPIIHAYF
jgi:hypothetical protein